MNKSSKIIWGIVLLLLAVGLVMYQLGSPALAFLPSIEIWQIALGLVFAITLLESIIHFSFGGILFSVAFLCIVFAEQLKIEALVPWTVLIAALLGTIAFHLLFGNKKNKGWNGVQRHYHENASTSENSSFFTDATKGETIEGEYIYERANFSGVTKYVHSDNFNYAHLENSFAGMEMFFDKVQVPSGQATIEIDAQFGGVEIYIPRNWKIVNNVHSFAGACEVDDRNWTGESDIVVTICGSNRFGGIEVRRL